jgi:hypothetical protein
MSLNISPFSLSLSLFSRKFLSTSSRRRDRLGGPFDLLSHGCWGFFSRGQRGGGVKLTGYIHLALRLGMRGATPPLTHVFLSWNLIKGRVISLYLHVNIGLPSGVFCWVSETKSLSAIPLGLGAQPTPYILMWLCLMEVKEQHKWTKIKTTRKS